MKHAKFILSLIGFGIVQLNAQTGLDSTSRKFNNSKLEIGTEYLVPTRFNNQIKTTNLNCYFWKKRFDKNYLLASFGLTATYAWGYSEQIKNLSDTSAELDIYKTAGFGIGPVMQVEHTILKVNRFSLVGEASGGVLLYSNRFPYGGDYYNFMFRMGPSISYRVSKNGYIKAGYRWMHVSNGKGFGNQNPFYEAQGAGISFIKML
jgi:lipid A 3-O-deacylase